MEKDDLNLIFKAIESGRCLAVFGIQPGGLEFPGDLGKMKKNEVEVKVKVEEVASFGQVFNASCAAPGSVRKKHLPRVDK